MKTFALGLVVGLVIGISVLTSASADWQTREELDRLQWDTQRELEDLQRQQEMNMQDAEEKLRIYQFDQLYRRPLENPC
jgi:uncharacterized membrane-anchored protein YhcB (DUF1043 family)